MNPIRILFLLYYYPPVLGTAAKRNFYISKAIAGKTEAAHIITITNDKQHDVSYPHVHITRIPAWDYRALFRRQSKDGALPETKKRSGVMQWLIRLINTFPINILAGEGGIVYFFYALKRGHQLINKEKITHIYSSFRPFTDHYAAYWLKKRNPHLYWIADFRDLIVDPHYRHILFSKKQQTFYKKIFSIADMLTTVSDGLASHLKSYNPIVLTIQNGITGDMPSPQPSPQPFFTIAYTGSMFLDKRNAEPLFVALQELFQETKMQGEDVRIIYAGKDSAYWQQLAKEYRFQSVLDDRGIVPDEEARMIQQQACINLLLTISSPELQGVLTGKMIEYFEAGSPVLGIVVFQNDPELQHILHELEIGDSFSDQESDLQGIKDFLYHEYLYWKKTGMNRKPVNTKKLSARFSVESVMRPLFEKI